MLLLVSCASQITELPKKPVGSNNTSQNPSSTSTTATYQDSPAYLKDEPIIDNQMTADNLTKPLIPTATEVALDTNTLLENAEQKFENQSYEQALRLFKLAAQRPDGQLRETYAGLYQTNLKLEHQIDAEQAFSKLLTISFQKNQKLNFKFLFEVNSTEFVNDKALRAEYSFWLRQIAQYFKNNENCFYIVGHNGLKEQQLSLLRAQKVRQMLTTYASSVIQRTKTQSKGHSDNLIGTGSNDIRDTLDRRVEIMMVNCNEL
jgi:outer membrane protein OmpA-like peptidoglycan-associated protein